MKKLVLLLLFSLPVFLPAQVLEEPGGFRHITVKEGLPSSEVYSFLQDRKGFIWMSTDAGVCRYNGYSFEVFTTRDGLADNTNFMLREDSRGRIWASGFSGAISYYDSLGFHGIPANDSLRKLMANGTRFLHCFSIDKKDGLLIGGFSTNGCYRIGPEDGYRKLVRQAEPFTSFSWRNVWVNPDGIPMAYSRTDPAGLSGSFYNHGKFVHHAFNDPSKINSSSSRVIVDRNKRLVYSIAGMIVTVDENGAVNDYRFDSQIVGIDEDHSGNIWLSFIHGGVWLCPGGNIAVARQLFFGGKTISSVMQDNENGYWFGTVGEGVYYLPQLEFGYLAPGNGLPFRQVMSLAPMSNGKMFVGLVNNTACIFNPASTGNDRLRYRTLEHHNDNSIETAFVRHDTILTCTDFPLLLDSNLRMIYSASNKSPGHSKNSAVNPVTGLPIFMSHANIIWFDNELRPDSTRNTAVRFTAACYGKNGVLWLGALNGLWKMENGQLIALDDSVSGVNERIDQICEDENGFLWLATRGEGVYVWKDNRKWHFGEKDGLSGNTCRAIVLDSLNRIWVGTNHGITLISNFDPVTGKARLRTFNSSDGLLSDEITHLAISGDRLWLGSNDGLCWIGTKELIKELPPPPVYITKVLFGNLPVDQNENAEFDYTDKSIRVFIEGLCFHDPAGLRYRYRLVGGSGDWITTENREISFTGLPPGDYSLEVVAVNNDGVSSLKPVIFSFHVLAPFYFTWWFIIGSVLLLLLLVWLIANDRFRRLRRRAQERAETERRIVELRLSALRAQMNPHFIFNAINSIQHFVLKNEGDQAYHYLARFSRLIRMVLEQSQSEFVTISQELEMLHLYVELEQLRFERPFEFKVEVDPVLIEENTRIPGMLIQPFVENSIWHGLLPKKSGEAIIRLTIGRLENGIHITIEDNGVGRDKAGEKNTGDGQHRSYGLKITQERLQLTERNLSGQPVITIHDLVDASGAPCGTRVEISVS